MRESYGAIKCLTMRRILLVLAFISLSVAILGAMLATGRLPLWSAGKFDYVVSVDLKSPDALASLPKIEGPSDAARPLVVIDAGHGGRDPGAGSGTIREKDLTAALALALRDDLLRGGGVRVALTRGSDRFLSLAERGAIGRRMRADLFISIHADSTEVETGAVGASVYTLSAKGSSEVAERIAARENAVDLIGGIPMRQEDNTVSAILVDLSQRNTQGKSEEFARLILREAQGKVPFKEASFQSAAFAVLKSPELPSVLLESGYINNPADLARLSSREGQVALAEVVGRAVRVYFARTSQNADGL